MGMFLRLSAFVLVCVGILTEIGNCQTAYPVKVAFFEDAYQQGRNHTATIGSQCYNMPSDFNDQISSFGEHFKGSKLQSRLVAFEHGCCQGDWISISPGDKVVDTLEDTRFNDRISSVRLKD